MASENDMKTSPEGDNYGTGSPVESPVRVPALSATVSVYVIDCGGLLKIGVAKDIKRRLTQMGSGMPVEPVVVGARNLANHREAYSLERKMHRRFHRHRVKGEWFAIGRAEAMRALNQMQLPPEGHMASKEWMKPTRQESRELVSEAMRRGRDMAAR